MIGRTSLHDFKIGLLKIFDLRNPVLLYKSIMERMLGVCLKVFVTVEMYRYPERMGILWTDLATDPKVFHPGYFGKFLGCRKKVSLSRRTCGMFNTKGYGVFHVQKIVTNAWLGEDSSFCNMDRVVDSSLGGMTVGKLEVVIDLHHVDRF
jgi:hypothetical protein